MKTILTTILLFVTLSVFGQIRPDQQPVDYSPTLSNEIYTMELGIVKRFLFSSLDSLFSSGSFTEITNVSDTAGISSPQLGDIAINSSNDTLMFRSTYGWIVFVGGSGGGGGGGTWGSITGTLSNQTDLQSALDAKLSTEVDGSVSNELDTITIAGNSGSADISDGETLTIAGGGIASTSVSGNTLTVTATEVDGSVSNEIQTIDTASFSSGTISLSLSSDGEAAKEIDISSIGTYSLNTTTADGKDTLDFNTQPNGYWRIDLSSLTTADSVFFENPLTTAVPTYTVHIDNATTDTIVWPPNLLDANRDTVGTRKYTTGAMMSFWYDGTNYITPAAVGEAATIPDPVSFDLDSLYTLIDAVSTPSAFWSADSVTTNGSHVTVWVDITGNGLNFSQIDTTKTGQLLSSEIGSRDAVDFASGDNYASGTTSSFDYLHDTGGTLFVVAQIGSEADPDALQSIMGTNNSSSASSGFSLDYDDRSSIPRNNRIKTFVSNSAGTVVSNVSSDNAVTPNSGYYVICLMLDPDNGTAADRSSIYINGGAAIANNSTGNAPDTGAQSFTLKLGNGGNGSNPFDGIVGTAIIYNSVLSSGNISTIMGHLNTYYGSLY